jgi:general stress protein 26
MMNPMSPADSERRKIRRQIQDAGVAMFMTLDERGQPTGRPMRPLLIENDPHLYFLTHQGSDKVRQVLDHPTVAVTIVGTSSFIVLKGGAEVLEDRTLVDRLWSPTYRAWFPEGTDDREATVLRITVQRVSYWEPPRSRMIRVWHARRVDTPMKTLDGL